MAGEQVEPVMQSNQQQQKQPKKDKKTLKESSAAAVPATSGDGLFYRAQLQVQPSPADRRICRTAFCGFFGASFWSQHVASCSYII